MHTDWWFTLYWFCVLLLFSKPIICRMQVCALITLNQVSLCTFILLRIQKQKEASWNGGHGGVLVSLDVSRQSELTNWEQSLQQNSVCVCMCVCTDTDHLLTGSLWICFHVGPEPLQHRKICVWAHFLFTRAQCNICKTLIISNSGRTTNMLIHLLATHAIKMQDCCVFWCLAGNRWIPSS